MKRRRMAFLGVGNMASALILANGGKTIDYKDIILYDKYPKNFDRFTRNGAYAAKTLSEAVSMADCVLMAVKPQDYFTLMDEIKQCEGYKSKLYVSIGAGIEVNTVSDYLSCNAVVRALPNTPMLIGKGVSAVCKSNAVSDEDYRFVYSLFECAGSAIEIDESEMNRIIGVTSSSPAYVFEFIKSIAAGASAQGLCGDELIPVICDVVIGSAMLLRDSNKTPDEMIAMVASKGGTTERALKMLAENDFSDIVKSAMIACTERADELGKTK